MPNEVYSDFVGRVPYVPLERHIEAFLASKESGNLVRKSTYNGETYGE